MAKVVNINSRRKSYCRTISTKNISVSIYTCTIRDVLHWNVCIKVKNGSMFFLRSRFFEYGKLRALRDTITDFRIHVRSVQHLAIK